VFDLDFDPPWRGASGLRGGGRSIASAAVGFASFSSLSFLLFSLGVHVGVICSVGFALLCLRRLSSYSQWGRTCLSLFAMLSGQCVATAAFAGVAVAAVCLWLMRRSRC
jgi:hypothetical protein